MQMQALQTALTDKTGKIQEIREKFKYESMILENERLLMSPAEYQAALDSSGAREAEEINLVDF